MAKSTTDPRLALTDILYGLKGIFKNYSRSARKEAWRGVQSAKGKAQIEKLLNNPDHPLVGIPRILDFKEWISRKAQDS